mgnify:CR=1 FL=1
MMRSIFAFLVGVYVGQEYDNLIPNVKQKTFQIFEEFKSTDFYKNIK